MIESRSSRSRYEKIVSGFSSATVMVIGDAMLDEYLWGEVSRISPEAPVPVVEINSSNIRLGGAANVAANLARLGVTTHLVALCGEDPDAERLRLALRECGLGDDGIIATNRRPTTLKTRIIAQHQQIVRTDRESRTALTQDEADRILSYVSRNADCLQAVVLSDYAKGVLSQPLLGPLIRLCIDRKLFVAVDPKKRFFEEYAGVSLITPNAREAYQALGLPFNSHFSNEEIRTMGWRLLDQLSVPGLLVTLGEKGMALFEARNRAFTHLETTAKKVYDVTGAGDTVISTYTASIAAGAEPIEAATLANHAAGLTVAELGTATVDSRDLLATIVP